MQMRLQSAASLFDEELKTSYFCIFKSKFSSQRYKNLCVINEWNVDLIHHMKCRYSLFQEEMSCDIVGRSIRGMNYAELKRLVGVE
uniref:Uncharacterized protein n=1 Tax=Parascaris univalens TaxID=6257 RepID=A0A914ZXU3_PARUN